MAAKKEAETAVVEDVLKLKALALDKARVRALWFDPEIGKRTCSSALRLIDLHSAKIEKEHPGFVLEEFRALPTICERIMTIQEELESMRARQLGVTNERVQESLEWRRRLVPLAETLAAIGKVNANEVAAIRQGSHGSSDNVRDVPRLVKLLRAHPEAVAGTLGKGALEKAHEVATRVIESLSTGSPIDAWVQEMTDLRDRYGTLVSEGHERMRLAVAVVFSLKEAEQIVDSLRPRGVRKTSGEGNSGGVESPPEPGPA